MFAPLQISLLHYCVSLRRRLLTLKGSITITIIQTLILTLTQTHNPKVDDLVFNNDYWLQRVKRVQIYTIERFCRGKFSLGN